MRKKICDSCRKMVIEYEIVYRDFVGDVPVCYPCLDAEDKEDNLNFPDEE